MGGHVYLYVKVCNVMHPDRILSMRVVILCVSPGFYFMYPDRILSMRVVILCVLSGFYFTYPDCICLCEL